MSKKLRKYPILAGLFLFLAIPLSGQDTPAPPADTLAPGVLVMEGDLADRLLPLDSLIEMALQRSPTLGHFDALIRQSAYQVDLARRLWLNNIYGFANYSTGDQRIVTAGTQIPGDVTTSSLATGYRAGVQINLPVFELTSRSVRIRLHEAEKDAAVHKKHEQQQDIVRQVIEDYYMMLGAYESLKTRAEGREAMQTYHMVAEQEFAEGILSLGDLSQIKTSLSQAEVYYHDARHSFYGRLASFAALVGVSIHELMKHQ